MSVGRLSMTFGWNKIGCFVVALCVSAAGAQLTAASEGGCQRHDSQARVALAVQGKVSSFASLANPPLSAASPSPDRTLLLGV